MPNPVNQGVTLHVTGYAKERNASGQVNYIINVHNVSGVGTNITIDGNDFP
jgi:hypothetical protein